MEALQDESTRVEEPTRVPAVKAKRTYGRKKDAVETLDDTSSITRPSLRTRLFSTRGTSSATESPVDASNLFRIADDLAAIDRQFEEEESRPTKGSRVRERTIKGSSSTKSPSTEEDSNSAADESILSAIAPPLSSSQSDPPSPGPVSPEPVRKLARQNYQDDNEGISGKLVNTSKSSDKAASKQLVIPPSSDFDQEDDADSSISIHKDKGDFKQQHEPENLFTSETKGRRKANLSREASGSKIKKLSKKEENETRKVHARHMAEQKVAITKRTTRHTIRDFLIDIANPRITGKGKQAIPYSSDPIQDFSSPAPAPAQMPSSPEPGPSAHIISDEDTPTMQDILNPRSGEKHDAEVVEQRRKSLALVKQRVLEKKERKAPQSDISDEDLELVVEDKHAKKSKLALDYEKRLANVAGFRPGRLSLASELDGSQGDHAIKLASKPAFSDVNRRTSAALNHRDLQHMIRNKAIKQSKELTREKEEEWESRGGTTLAKLRAGQLIIEDIAKQLIERRVHGVDDEKLVIQDSEADRKISDDEDDGDWRPLERGSASPTARSIKGSDEEEELEDEVSNNSENENPDENIQPTPDTEGPDSPNQRQRHIRRAAKRTVMLDSDDENEDDRGRVLVPHTSLVIDDNALRDTELSEGEENKENDTRLAFENGEDKENIAVSSQGLAGSRLGTRQPSIFDLSSGPSRFSMSPSPSPRRPLQARRSDDDALIFRSPPSILTFGSPKSNRVVSSTPSTLQPAFGDFSNGGFSQIFNDSEGILQSDGSATPKDSHKLNLKSPGDDFSSLQSSFEPLPLKTNTFSDDFLLGTQDASPVNRFRRQPTNDDISLTPDVKLQLALEVPTQMRMNADSVFEKEQEDLAFMEEADFSTSKRQDEKTLYVNEIGMLTQTRPDDSTPVIYRMWTPTQKEPAILGTQATIPPSSVPRQPLSTLSFTSEETPSLPRLSRLRKGKDRAISPIDGGNDSDIEPMTSNAFTKLLQAAKNQNKKEKKKLGKSEFIEGEAQESDEDELLGFGGGKKYDEEDSDDDDPDAVVENLVDDATMNAEQLAEDKVLEKVKEQLEEEDAALQKYHQAAVEGKYRTKRRGGGLAMSDSDSDLEEDEETRRLRRRMNKKRRIEGDTLEALAKNEKTRAFYDAYQRDVMEDDNEDFAHLEQDDMEVLEQDDENEPPETVSAAVIREQLREAARKSKGKEKQHHAFNPEDVNWAEPKTSDDEFDVKEIEEQARRSTRRRPVFGQTDIPDYDDSLPRKTAELDAAQVAQLSAWRKEQSGRNLGTGGTRGAITVTGHGNKNNNSRGGTSISRGTRPTPSGAQPEPRRKVTKTASVLASMTSKQKRFGR